MIKDCVKALASSSVQLTEWELEFIESVESQFDENGTLSQKQMEILESIWEKI